LLPRHAGPTRPHDKPLDHPVMRGLRVPTTNLWTIPLHSPAPGNDVRMSDKSMAHAAPAYNYPPATAHSAYHTPNLVEHVKFLHAPCGNPIPSTWIQAIDKWSFCYLAGPHGGPRPQAPSPIYGHGPRSHAPSAPKHTHHTTATRNCCPRSPTRLRLSQCWHQPCFFGHYGCASRNGHRLDRAISRHLRPRPLLFPCMLCLRLQCHSYLSHEE
jgi:hypothetical protein